jgi:hypothetical protein
MNTNKRRQKPSKCLSSSTPTITAEKQSSTKRNGLTRAVSAISAEKQNSEDRYSLNQVGPGVSSRATNLVGRSINAASSQARTSTQQHGGKMRITTNVEKSKKGTNESETSISEITSTADIYNSYRLDEASALKTNKMMMSLHLKDQMFRRMKFITNGSMLVYSNEPATVCGYVCTNMRVPESQWPEYWELMKQPTRKMIEQQRTNATSAIKKGFKGMYPSSKDQQTY